MLKLSRLLLFSILSYAGHSFAGGPSDLGGINGNTPVTYQEPKITIHVEGGDLSMTSNAVAVTLMQEAFDLWNTVTTSTINLNIDPSALNFEIDFDNYDDFLPNANSDDVNFDDHDDDNLNPVVFDSTGEIIDAYLGEKQSEIVLGFATSFFDKPSGKYIEGYVVINGLELGSSITEIKLIFAHEIGHFFGLDHSQSNIDNQEAFFAFPGFCSTTSTNNYPLMYPVACRSVSSLHTDDISAVSALYPETNIDDNFGILEGLFTTDTGSALLGANIWAENMVTGEIYSIVSDYLREGTGFYQVYLPASNYTLHANSINTAFIGGSGVGPYSNSPSDVSFSSPHPITPFTYQDAAGTDIIITIAVNETVVIDFSSIDITPPITPPDTIPKDEGDSISDVFGSTSHLTLLLLLVTILISRRLNRSFNPF